MSYRIFIAEKPEEFRSAQKMVAAYAEFLGMDLSFQNFDAEMEGFCDMYGAPRGSMILLEVDGVVVGAVGLRPFADDTAEMKRMYILPEFQGRGFANSLVSAFIDKAVELNYKSIKLDTIPRLDKALSLYKKFGFNQIAPYRHNPDPNAIYMELKIS